MKKRLKQARESAKLTQQNVATILNIPRTAIALIESGKRYVSSEEMEKLSEIYRFSKEWLAGEVGEDDEPHDEEGRVTDPWHGAARQAERDVWSDAQLDAVEDELKLFRIASDLRSRIGFGADFDDAFRPLLSPSYPSPPSYMLLPPSGTVEVYRLFGIPHSKWPGSYLYEDFLRDILLYGHADNHYDHTPPFEHILPSSKTEAIEQGERYAEVERLRLGMGAAPVGDMAELLMDQNVWFSMVEMPLSVSGIFIRDSKFGMAILTNSARKAKDDLVESRRVDASWLHYTAQRFSIVHEYAHTLFDNDRLLSVSSTNRTDVTSEQRANAFAGAFLLPKAGVEAELRRGDKGRASRTRHLSLDFATGSTLKAESRQSVRSQTVGFHDVTSIASHFGVSYKMAVIRLISLGFVKEPHGKHLLTQQSLASEYSKMTQKSDGDPYPDLSGMAKSKMRKSIAHLAVELMRRGDISVVHFRSCAKSIGVDGDGLLELARKTRTD